MCEKIQDFGQKIGGARKDMYQAAKEQAEKFMEAASVETLTSAKTLSALVKLPNLESLVKANAISEDAARGVFAIWRSIDRRPASSYRVGTWVRKTAPKLAKIATILNDSTVDEKTRNLPEFRVLEAAGWPSEAFSFGKYTVSYDGWSLPHDIKERKLRIISGRYYKGSASTNPADIVEQLRSFTTDDSARRAEGPALDASHNRAGRWYIHPNGKKEICVKVLPEGADCNEVRRVLKEERAELLEIYKKIKTVPELRHDWNRPRVGKDWRTGIDATPETFSAALPFRGVEFGNWVNQTERAALLNSAFDGFHDLAQILTLSPADVTLRGSLSFAFASRGIAKAMAHYESDHKVINLTKKKGAGCMAHEWFHAVDNFAAGGCVDSFASEGQGGGSFAYYGNALYQAIRNTDFFNRSKNLASIKGEYWIRPRELAARGFEGVVAFLLKKAGICSDFLVNCLTMDEFTAADTLHRSDFYPYPTEHEAAALTPYYFNLLQLVFGIQSCKIDSETTTEIERHSQAAEREREEAKAQRMAKEQAEREARAAVAAKEDDRHREQMEARAKEVAAEIGADWYHVFKGYSNAYCAIGANSEFLFIVEHNLRASFRILTGNPRMKKDYRPAGGCYFEVKPGADYHQSLVYDCKYGFCAYNKNLTELFRSSHSCTFADFREKYAMQIEEERQKRQNAAEARVKKEKAADIKDNPRKTEKRPQNAENKPSDGDDSPHESLTLETMDNGVFVSGSTRATYYNRCEIKAHGATWNKESKRWEATDPEAIARLREWFGVKRC